MNVLAIGAHPDDVELGCGGALLAHRAKGDRVSMLIMTTGERGPQDGRSRMSEQEDAADLLGARLLWGGLADGDIACDREAVGVVEDAIACTNADLVYTHVVSDTHQDHRATAEATLAAARKGCQVLCFESPSTRQFIPTVFVDVARHLEGKLDLIRAHMSQVMRCGLIDLEAIEASARYRGFQARIRMAEAFEPQRFVWDLAPSTLTPEPIGFAMKGIAL